MLAEGREAADARAYLAERGIDRESAERFGIGFAPGVPRLPAARLAREFSPEILLEAGLATRGDDGTVRDRFRGRITFPSTTCRDAASASARGSCPPTPAPASRRST